MIHYLGAGLFVLLTLRASGQDFNRPTPNHVPAYEFVQFDSANTGFYMTSPFKLGLNANDPAFSIPKALMILDADGYLAWYMIVNAQNVLDFKYIPALQAYSFIKYHDPTDTQFMLLDESFQLIDSFTTTNGVPPDVHDFQTTANQTYLLSGIRDSIIDLSSVVINGMPGDPQTHALGFVVQEQDEDHNVLFQWDSNDHIPPEKGYTEYGYNPQAFDYCHGNAIEEEQDGSLLLSFRNMNAVYKIDRPSGQVLWELGGKTSSFSFFNDPGFSAQHDIRRLPNGNISLFDNANMAAAPPVSRAVEYSLDTINWIATKVWEFRYTPGFLSPAMGNHQTTADRRHLINYGLNFRPYPSFVLTDDAGSLLSELFFQDSFMSYRSFLFDLPLGNVPRPAISCAQDNGVVVLSAPPGYDRYEWSTGAQTTGIQVSEQGTYQVWTNYGMGMLGSKPFVISDLDQACPVSALEEIESSPSREILGYYDLLGRAVSLPVTGTIYAVRYGDGRMRLQVY